MVTNGHLAEVAMGVELTMEMIEAATPGEGGKRSYLWDSEVPGFGVRIGARTKVYIVKWRTKAGQQRRTSIGRVGVIPLEDARSIARDRLAQVARGADPQEKKAARKTVQKNSLQSLAAVFQRSLAALAHCNDAGPHADPGVDLLSEMMGPRQSEQECKNTSRASAGKTQDLLAAWRGSSEEGSSLQELLSAEIHDDELRLIFNMLALNPRIANQILDAISQILDGAESLGLRPAGSNPCRAIFRYDEEFIAAVYAYRARADAYRAAQRQGPPSDAGETGTEVSDKLRQRAGEEE